MWFLENAWLVPLVPAVCFAIILLLGKRLPTKGSAVGIAGVATSFVLSCGAAVQWIQHVNAGGSGHAEGGATESHSLVGSLVGSVFPRLAEGGEEHHVIEPITRSVDWFTIGGHTYHANIQVDGLSVLMLFTVTFISLLVHVYSLEYLKGDRRYTHYFAFLSLFTASMLAYVLSGNILQMLVCWELVGVCSFALIGHWWEEKPNTDAALKAFLTNRVGDVGLIIGVIILFFTFGTFDTIAINLGALEANTSHLALLVASLALFAAVTSKSGQFPLHTWLPDAMAGPTPVSALIHAATMVVAGVYLIARLYPVFFEGLSIGHSSINYVAFIGGFTTLIGAGLAFVQKDIKKVLAYSTISQLGYMVMALGVGAWTAGVFHMFTHAFFKACLFLGAGSVSHAAHHTFDMTKMGGLRKYMKTTFATFLIASVALAGIPPFAGFWSKDEILAGAANGQESAYTFMLVMGLLTAFMTAAYMTRTVWMTFFGEYRGEGTPHESPKVMTVPLIILAAFAVLLGLANIPAKLAPDSVETRFEHFVEPTYAFPSIEHAEFNITLAGVSSALALLGIAMGYFYFFKNRSPFHGLTERNKAAKAGHTFLENKYYLDHLYSGIIVPAVRDKLSAASYWFNQKVLDGIVNGAATVATGLGRLTYKYVDQGVVDRAINASGEGAEGSGQLLRKIQTGKVQQYGALLFLGAAVLAGALILLI
jgi:NADH-quinone oxidoreductase subunit L